MSSRDLDSALPADSKEVGQGSGDSDAAQNESEARLRRSLLRATANNARLSSVALGFATLYVGTRDSARLYFLTRTTSDGFVITGNHRRAAREIKGRYLSGAAFCLSVAKRAPTVVLEATN